MAKKRSFKDVGAMFSKVKEELIQSKESGNNSYSSSGPKKKWSPSLEKNQDHVKYKVRFLPNLYSETGSPIIERKIHGFGPFENGFYDRCRKSINEPCYVCDAVNPLFKTGNKLDEDKAMNRYGKKRFIANILVIEDPRDDGANEGKVFMWEFGKKIKVDKLDQAIDQDFCYYHPMTGSTFNIDVKRVSGYPNYDASIFDRNSTPIADTDEKIDAICDMTYDLAEECLNPDLFSSYEEQKYKYDAFDAGKDMKEVNRSIYDARKNKTIESAKSDSSLPTEKVLNEYANIKTEKIEESNSTFEIKEEIKDTKTEEKTEEDSSDGFDLSAFEKELENIDI